MITISATQFEALRDRRVQDLIERLITRFRQRFPDQLGHRSDEQLTKLAHIGMERARGYGFRTEAQIRLFIDLMVLHGPRFDVDSRTIWAGDILNDASLSPAEKFARLDEAQTFLEKGA